MRKAALTDDGDRYLQAIFYQHARQGNCKAKPAVSGVATILLQQCNAVASMA
jgi:hypothetical protein